MPEYEIVETTAGEVREGWDVWYHGFGPTAHLDRPGWRKVRAAGGNYYSDIVFESTGFKNWSLALAHPVIVRRPVPSPSDGLEGVRRHPASVRTPARASRAAPTRWCERCDAWCGPHGCDLITGADGDQDAPSSSDGLEPGGAHQKADADKGWRASLDVIEQTTNPAVAIHHAINMASRADNDRRRYINTHVTGDALSVLVRAGWQLAKPSDGLDAPTLDPCASKSVNDPALSPIHADAKQPRYVEAIRPDVSSGQPFIARPDVPETTEGATEAVERVRPGDSGSPEYDAARGRECPVCTAERDAACGWHPSGKPWVHVERGSSAPVPPSPKGEREAAGAAVLAGLLDEAEGFVRAYAESRDASLMGDRHRAEDVAERLNRYAVGAPVEESAPEPTRGEREAPATVEIRFCPECGGNDRHTATVHTGRHGLGTPVYKCPGEIQTLVYARPPVPPAPEDGEGHGDATQITDSDGNVAGYRLRPAPLAEDGEAAREALAEFDVVRNRRAPMGGVWSRTTVDPSDRGDPSLEFGRAVVYALPPAPESAPEADDA